MYQYVVSWSDVMSYRPVSTLQARGAIVQPTISIWVQTIVDLVYLKLFLKLMVSETIQMLNKYWKGPAD